MTDKFIEELEESLRVVKDDAFCCAAYIINIDESEEIRYFGSDYKKSHMFDFVYEIISLSAPDAYREFKANKVVEKQFKTAGSKLSLITLHDHNMVDRVELFYGTGKQFKNFFEVA